MKININSEHEYKDLRIGQVFDWKGNLYLVTDQINPDVNAVSRNWVNHKAVKLVTGEMQSFQMDTVVMTIDMEM